MSYTRAAYIVSRAAPEKAAAFYQLVSEGFAPAQALKILEIKEV